MLLEIYIYVRVFEENKKLVERVNWQKQVQDQGGRVGTIALFRTNYYYYYFFFSKLLILMTFTTVLYKILT